MKGTVHSCVLSLMLSVCDIGLGWLLGVISTSKPQPACMRLTPWSSFSQWSPSQALWHHSVGEDWWISQTLTTWAINLWHYPFTLVAAVNNYGMFMEATGTKYVLFHSGYHYNLSSYRDWTSHLQKKNWVRECVHFLHIPMLMADQPSLQTPLCNENITGY